MPLAASGRANDNDDSTMLCKRVVTKDRRYITQITCYEKGQEVASSTGSASAEGTLGNGGARKAMKLPVFGGQQAGRGALAALFQNLNRRQLEGTSTQRTR